MRDVVVIGGGLTGLTAAWALEHAGVPYTMIEVKPRLGGGTQTVTMGPFHFDVGPMLHELSLPEQCAVWLDGLGIADAFHETPAGQIELIAGTGVLIDALAKQVSAPIMYRMAVSTLGRMDDGRFSICMENGMVLDAKALIIAAPARYAERMLYTLVPEAAVRLLDYRYDHIARLSVGYANVRLDALNLVMPEDFPIARLQSSAHRGPVDGCVVQVALRYDPTHGLPQDPVGEVAALMDWPLNPDADHIAVWPESDPIMFLDDAWPQALEFVQNMLPPGVALVGSDYVRSARPPRLDERMQQGFDAVQKVMKWLKQA